MIELTWNNDRGCYCAEFDGKHIDVTGDAFAETEQNLRDSYIAGGMPEEEAEAKAWEELRWAEVWTPDMHGVEVMYAR
jgi:hypothetical protein